MYVLQLPAIQGNLIECRKCRKQYVGETQNPLHIHLNGHRNDRRTEKQVAVTDQVTPWNDLSNAVMRSF